MAKTVLPLLLPPPPPQQQAKVKKEERERAIDHTWAADFHEKSARRRSPPRERPQPHGRDRRSAPTHPRSPPMRALPGGGSRIHWGLIRPYDAHAEFGEHVARPRDKASLHNSVAAGSRFSWKIRQASLPSQGVPATAWSRPLLNACPPAASPHAGTARKGFKHPLGTSTPLRCIRRVWRACSSAAGPRIPPQLCRHLYLFNLFIFF